MRISDWSSDVCSSDLIEVAGDRCVQAVIETGAQAFDQVDRLGYALALARHFAALHGALRLPDAIERTLHHQLDQPARAEIGRASCRERVGHSGVISGIAVYLKKKKQQINNTQH